MVPPLPAKGKSRASSIDDQGSDKHVDAETEGDRRRLVADQHQQATAELNNGRQNGTDLTAPLPHWTSSQGTVDQRNHHEDKRREPSPVLA